MMLNKNFLVSIVLFIICVLLTVVILFYADSFKKAELSFNEKKAVLVKENLDIKERLNALEESFKKKTAEAAFEGEKRREIEGELAAIKAESEKLSSEYEQLKDKYKAIEGEKKSLSEEINSLREKYVSLSANIDKFEKMSSAQLVEEAIGKEQDAQVRSLLQSALQGINAAQGAGSVSLSTIIVRGRGKQSGVVGEVVSAHPQDNLLIVSLGRKDRIRQGNRCIVLKDDEEIAEGEVVSVNNRASAVFINSLGYKKTVFDIKEGDKVLIKDS